ncbi:S8 family peptidase [Streptomyces sp. NPDC060031]|uniref:S8 family peptidase n=1 Tax=Streptomyces sp. NPDC060031 TaxID=3347043 RepID=UPI0036BF853B
MTPLFTLFPAAALLAAATLSAPAPAETPTAAYVVVLRDYASRAPVRALAAEAEAAGDRVGAVYDTVLNGFAVRTTAARAAALAADPRVASVEPDAEFRISDGNGGSGDGGGGGSSSSSSSSSSSNSGAAALAQSPAPWPLDRIDQRELPLDGSYAYATQARGVTAYVVDTGINILHQEFAGRARFGVNTVSRQSADDCNGHGTHVAGTIGGATYGVAKGVSLVAVKVADCRGNGNLSAMIGGLDWMVRDALAAGATPAVANMSMGGSYSFALNRAVRRAVAAGITFTVAAGNARENSCAGSPASVSQAVTVGATDATDRWARFSNYGRCVDLAAPGVSVTSAWKGSATATARASGTSMAAPHVAGAAALILAGGTARTPAQVFRALVRDAVPGRITALPAGTPNLLLHTPTRR